MISSLVAGRFAHALRATRTLLGAVFVTPPSPRKPYVQGVTTSSAVICWVSERPDAGVVEYGHTPELGGKVADAWVGRRHAVALTGLGPGSTYYYRVAAAGRSSATGCFRTAPVEEDSSFAFAVVGDSGSGGKRQLAVAGLLKRLRPDLVLHTGDVVYPAGKERHFDRRFFAPYGDLIKEVPIFPVHGNHDVRRRKGTAFLENFHPPLGSPRSTKRYYSFDWGGVHFVALDTELYYHDKDSRPEEQKAFL